MDTKPRYQELEHRIRTLEEREALSRTSAQQCRAILEDLPIMVCAFLPGGEISFVNRCYSEYFNRTSEQLVGTSFYSLIPEDDREAVAANTATLTPASPSWSYELRIIDPDGGTRWQSWTNCACIDDQGRITNYLACGEDITEQRQATETIQLFKENLQHHERELEQNVTRRTAELAMARDRAETADRLKSAFLATMSHELRTPLNSIIGFTGILLQGLVGPLNTEQTKQLAMVQNSGRHLLNLINDVLDLSKIEAGQLELSNKPFDLREVVESAVQSIAPQAEKGGVAVRLDMAEPVPSLTGDRRRTEQVLINLLNNAVKFSLQGGEIRVEVSLATRQEVSVAGQDQVKITVADAGIGIASEALDMIFEPFRQIDTGLTRRFEGTGLGLSICKRLVEMLGGEIRAESAGPGKGSRFTFTLPVG